MLLKYGSILIDVRLKRHQKNMYLKPVDEHHAIISAPADIDQQEIVDFVQEKGAWLIEKTAILSTRLSIGCPSLLSRSVYVLGKCYPQQIIYGSPNTIMIDRNQVIVRVKTMDDEHYQLAWNNYAKSILMKIVDQLRIQYDDHIHLYHIQSPTIRIKVLKRAWGNCYPRKQLIQLSTRLIHYDPTIIEAVLAHEYVHLIIPNHSKRFYDILTSWMPDYHKRHDQLKGIDG